MKRRMMGKVKPVVVVVIFFFYLIFWKLSPYLSYLLPPSTFKHFLCTWHFYLILTTAL